MTSANTIIGSNIMNKSSTTTTSSSRRPSKSRQRRSQRPAGCCLDGMFKSTVAVAPPISTSTTTTTVAANIVSEGFIEIVFLLLGVGILLPWNAFISAKQYFEARLCDPSASTIHTDDLFAQNIEMWFAIIYNGGTVLSLAVVILVQYFVNIPGHESHQQHHQQQIQMHQQPQQQQQQQQQKPIKFGSMIIHGSTNMTNPMSPISTKTLRIDTTRGGADYTWYMVMVPLAAYLGVFAVTTILVFVTYIPPSVFLLLTLSGLFVCGVCTAVASSGIVGTAGLFEPDVGVNPFFNGQAVGGLLVACGNFLASVLNGPERYYTEHCEVGVVIAPSTAATSSSMEDSTTTTTTTTSLLASISEGDPSSTSTSTSSFCVPYSDVSWATAGYFSIGCLVLAASMVGYSYVDQYKRLVRDQVRYSSIHVHHYDYDDDDYHDDDADEDDDRDDHHNDQLISRGIKHSRKRHQIQHHMSIEDTPTPPPEANVFVTAVSTAGPSGTPELALSKWRKRASVSFASYQNGDIIEQIHEYEGTTAPATNSTDHNSIDSENTQNLTMSVWASVRGAAVSLFFTYFCTLAIFPVWTSELISTLQCQPSSTRIRNDLFMPFSFILFNAGDLVGRSMSGMVKIDKVRNMSSKLVWASVLRMAFFFLFLLCKARLNLRSMAVGNGHRTSFWVVEDTDMFSWTVQFIFAVTNGFLTNITFCYAAGQVENKAHPQQVASAILNFTLSFGLLIGSFCSGPYLSFASGIW